MFRTVPLSIISSFFTVHTAVNTGLLTACEQAVSCQQTCMTYTTAVCTVKKLLMMDRGTVRNM